MKDRIWRGEVEIDGQVIEETTEKYMIKFTLKSNGNEQANAQLRKSKMR